MNNARVHCSQMTCQQLWAEEKKKKKWKKEIKRKTQEIKRKRQIKLNPNGYLDTLLTSFFSYQ